MIRRFVFAAALVAFTFALAYSDDQNVRIYKVDGNKVTWKKTKLDPDTKKAVVEEKEFTSTVGADAKFEKAGKGKGAKAEEIAEGLKSETFTKIGEKGIAATITTADADGKGNISKILVKGGGKGKAKAGAN